MSKPQHIAIVMDGNGRWAKRRFMPRIAGHRQGVESLRRCVQACLDRDVTVLTVFAFSSENWSRPPEEVSGLMELMVGAMGKEMAQLKANGVRICFVGERQGLSDKVIKGVERGQDETRHNTKLVLNICFNYGGRWDIVQAANQLAANGQGITEASLHAATAMAHVPDPDLLIRTGGEMRISNFLLWQAAYSELYFSDKLWPEFDETELDKAIAAFAGRERRFGKISEQIQGKADAKRAGSSRSMAAVLVMVFVAVAALVTAMAVRDAVGSGAGPGAIADPVRAIERHA